MTASTAQAALPAPVLTSTNPVSPNSSLTPRVQGEISEEGGETKAIPLGVGLSAAGVGVSAAEPDNAVTLYTDPSCTGTPVGEGTVEVLEGSGVQVSEPVAEDAVTTFYATQDNEAESPSDCSQGLAYRQVTNLPEAPVLEAVTPASPANHNFPHLLGSADAEATVSIYVGASCTGAAVASGSGAEFASPGILVSVADNSETTFSARASIAGFTSGCSPAPIVYREVTPPPDPGGEESGGGEPGGDGPAGGTPPPGPPAAGQPAGGAVSPALPVPPPPPPRLHTVPGGSANNNTPLVVGAAPGASAVRIHAGARCDGPVVATGSAAQLGAGIPMRVVDNVVVAFSAVSVAGATASRCSDSVVYVEDSLTPRTRITMGPAAKTRKRKAVFRFTDSTGDAAGTKFRCRVNKRKWRNCSSPLRLRKLRPRRYVLRVKAVDLAGNTERKAAKRRFKVIRRP